MQQELSLTIIDWLMDLTTFIQHFVIEAKEEKKKISLKKHGL